MFITFLFHCGAPGGIRTHGLQFRKLTLYPAELRVLIIYESTTYILPVLKLLVRYSLTVIKKILEQR